MVWSSSGRTATAGGGHFGCHQPRLHSILCKNVVVMGGIMGNFGENLGCIWDMFGGYLGYIRRKFGESVRETLGTLGGISGGNLGGNRWTFERKYEEFWGTLNGNLGKSSGTLGVWG